MVTKSKHCIADKAQCLGCEFNYFSGNHSYDSTYFFAEFFSPPRFFRFPPLAEPPLTQFSCPASAGSQRALLYECGYALYDSVLVILLGLIFHLQVHAEKSPECLPEPGTEAA